MHTPDSTNNYRQFPDNRQLGHIPGIDGLPWLGRTIAVVRDLYAVSKEHVQRFGPVSRLGLMGQTGLLVTGADLYQRIFQDSEQLFSCEKGYEQQLGAFYPRGLLLKDFDEHRAQRRLMQGAFKSAALQRYLEMMQPVIDTQVKAWGTHKHFVFYPAIKQLLLEIGTRCFLGIDNLGPESQRINDLFLDLNSGMISLMRIEAPFGSYGRAKRARRELESWFESMIQQRRADPASGDDMLSHLCREVDEEGRPYSTQMIVDHIIFLLFAAHDTSTSALTHLAMYLGRAPDLQQRLRDEALFLGQAPLKHEDLARMPFAEHCFNESLRLHPPVPMMVRRTVRDCELAGLQVPAHTVLYLPSMMNQRDPQWWTDPENFDPDRFAAPRSEHRRHPMCFNPFGSGAHKCIGMHFAMMMVKVFLHRFVLDWQFSTAPGYAPRLEWVPLPKPADGVPLRLRATSDIGADVEKP